MAVEGLFLRWLRSGDGWRTEVLFVDKEGSAAQTLVVDAEEVWAGRDAVTDPNPGSSLFRGPFQTRKEASRRMRVRRGAEPKRLR